MTDYGPKPPRLDQTLQSPLSARCETCGHMVMGPDAQTIISGHLRLSETCESAMVIVARRLTKRHPTPAELMAQRRARVLELNGEAPATSNNGLSASLPR